MLTGRRDQTSRRVSDGWLDGAAQRVVTGWAEPGNGPGAGQVALEVAGLVRHAETGAPLPAPEDASQRRLRYQLLGRLQTELVQGWVRAPEPASDGTVHQVLRRLDESRSAIADARLHADDAAFNTPGMELAVELAHDLRSPLTSIIFLSEAMRQGEDGSVTPLQRRQLALIYSAAVGLSSLASDLVDMSVGVDRLLRASPRSFDVGDVLGSVCDIVQPIAEEKQITLRSVSPPGPLRTGEPMALHRVLLNLVSNALDFTEAGFVEIIARPLDDETLEFSVRDTGPGIDQAARRSLYEPIQAKGNGSRRGISRSGLGLAIARRWLGAAGSELQYETHEGWGTRFFFRMRLPAAPP